MHKLLTLTIYFLALLPASALAGPTAVSSSAQLVPDKVGDASPAADLTAFSLHQDATRIYFGWEFAATVDIRSQQLQVCAVGHARTACIVSPTRMRINGRYIPVRVRYVGQRITVSVPATALGFSKTATSRSIRFRAKVGLMASACGGPCTDYSPVAYSGIDL